VAPRVHRLTIQQARPLLRAIRKTLTEGLTVCSNMGASISLSTKQGSGPPIGFPPALNIICTCCWSALLMLSTVASSIADARPTYRIYYDVMRHSILRVVRNDTAGVPGKERSHRWFCQKSTACRCNEAMFGAERLRGVRTVQESRVRCPHMSLSDPFILRL